MCVNDISIIKRNRCYYTRPSDHSVVTAELKLNSPQQKSCAQNTSREILVNSKEDVIKFREVLNETSQSICRWHVNLLLGQLKTRIDAVAILARGHKITRPPFHTNKQNLKLFCLHFLHLLKKIFLFLCRQVPKCDLCYIVFKCYCFIVTLHNSIGQKPQVNT